MSVVKHVAIRLEDFLKMSSRGLGKRKVAMLKTSWRRLKDISRKHLEDISLRRLQDVLKAKEIFIGDICI